MRRCSIITFRLNFSATAKVISVPPVLSWCYYLTFYYVFVDFEMASCYFSHSRKISDWLIDWLIDATALRQASKSRSYVGDVWNGGWDGDESDGGGRAVSWGTGTGSGFEVGGGGGGEGVDGLHATDDCFQCRTTLTVRQQLHLVATHNHSSTNQDSCPTRRTVATPIPEGTTIFCLFTV